LCFAQPRRLGRLSKEAREEMMKWSAGKCLGASLIAMPAVGYAAEAAVDNKADVEKLAAAWMDVYNKHGPGKNVQRWAGVGAWMDDVRTRGTRRCLEDGNGRPCLQQN
jgi:hypothetical protein